MQDLHSPILHHILALFGWRIQPDSASHNNIFLSREISQLSSQQYFPLTRNQPASQPNKPNRFVSASQPASQLNCFC